MNFLINLDWLSKSLVVMVCMIPLVIMFNFFGKNYGVRPEALTFAWVIGVGIGVAFSVYSLDMFDTKILYTPLIPLLVIVLLGIVFGTPVNILLVQAVPQAPNPALPFTIMNIGSVGAYLLAPALAILLPKYFDSMSFNWVNLTGVSMVAIGLGLVMYQGGAK